jgi:hypothetical protein
MFFNLGRLLRPKPSYRRSVWEIRRMIAAEVEYLLLYPVEQWEDPRTEADTLHRCRFRTKPLKVG